MPGRRRRMILAVAGLMTAGCTNLEIGNDDGDSPSCGDKLVSQGTDEELLGVAEEVLLLLSTSWVANHDSHGLHSFFQWRYR